MHSFPRCNVVKYEHIKKLHKVYIRYTLVDLTAYYIHEPMRLNLRHEHFKPSLAHYSAGNNIHPLTLSCMGDFHAHISRDFLRGSKTLFFFFMGVFAKKGLKIQEFFGMGCLNIF